MTRAFRLFAFLVVGLLLGGSASFCFAGSVRYEFRGVNVTREGGQTHIRGTAPSEIAAVSGGVFSASGSATVSGQTAAFTSASTLATGAATVAVSAIRLNPTGLIGSAVISWLLTKGIEQINGQFMKKSSPAGVYEAGYKWCSPSLGICSATGLDACLSYGAAVGVAWQGAFQTCTPDGQDSTHQYFDAVFANATMQNWPFTKTVDSCPSGMVASPSGCIGSYAPANDADWEPLANGPIPDDAATEIIKGGVKLPVSPPDFTPKQRDIPLSDPYRDAVTDKPVRDYARVTPQPSTPESAKLEVTKQPVDEQTGEPLVDETTGNPVAGEEKSDLCLDHPDALACWEAGDPEDVDLEKDTKDISISPDGGWGASSAACPADLSHTLRTGQTVAFKWAPVCTGASMFRPVVIGMAWLASIFVFLGMTRKSQGG